MSLPLRYTLMLRSVPISLTPPAIYSAWKTLAKQKMNEDVGFAINLIGDLGDYMITDMDLNKLSDLSGYLADYEYKGILKIEGESRQGERFMEFYCNDASLKQAVLDLFYDQVS